MSERIEMITHWKISNLIAELENGNLRIPRFQREYVWEPSKVVKLINSIYKEYPIGSFFLWETDKQMQSFCRDMPGLGLPDHPESGKFSFILDGQQRITSLYVGLRGLQLNNRDYSKICFNLDRKEFYLPRLKIEQNDIPACRLYDQTESMKIVAEYSALGKNQYVAEIINCSNLLRTYPLSVIKSVNMGLDEVVDIFERINQGGKRLSLFDLVHASVWSDDFDLREKIDEFNSEPAIKLFGEIGAEVFTQALALNINSDCTNRQQLELTRDDCKRTWGRTIECIRLAIDFVKKNCGVQQLAIIPYASLISVIQHYFFTAENDVIGAADKSLIADWMWSVSFSQRYSSSTLTRMKEDADWIRSLISGIKKPRVFSVKLKLSDLRKSRMNQRSVIKNAVLCVMAMSQPCDFDNGDPVTLDKTNASRSNSKENHHFFPFSLHETFSVKRADINSVLNFAFITKRLNLDISNKKPSEYLAKYAGLNEGLSHCLETHYIDSKALDAAKKDDFESFVTHRGKGILAEIEKLCHVNDGVDTIQSGDFASEEDDDDEDED